MEQLSYFSQLGYCDLGLFGTFSDANTAMNAQTVYYFSLSMGNTDGLYRTGADASVTILTVGRN